MIMKWIEGMLLKFKKKRKKKENLERKRGKYSYFHRLVHMKYMNSVLSILIKNLNKIKWVEKETLPLIPEKLKRL